MELVAVETIDTKRVVTLLLMVFDVRRLVLRPTKAGKVRRRCDRGDCRTFR